MLYDFRVPIGWGELLKRTVRETVDDNGLGLAAQLAYYYFLALFPTLLVLLALASLLPSEDLIGQVVSALQGVAPAAAITIIRDQLNAISANRPGGLLTAGVVVALWSSSAALVAIIGAVNQAYDVEEGRPWWKQRVIAVLLTIGLALFVLVSFALVVAGPEMGQGIADLFGMGQAFIVVWHVVQWPVVFLLVATGFGLVYYFGPNVEQSFVWLTPGSILAAALWLGGSLGFRIYVSQVGSYTESYGTIGGIMVLLLWFYLSGLVLILGAELNSEIAHASRATPVPQSDVTRS